METTSGGGELDSLNPNHIIVAVLGALGLWLAQRLAGKAAVQTALNQGFDVLYKRQAAVIDELRATIREERIQHAAEIETMRRGQQELRDHVADLTEGMEAMASEMAKRGVTLPRLPVRFHEEGAPPLIAAILEQSARDEV
jgi:cell division protein FtsB